MKMRKTDWIHNLEGLQKCLALILFLAIVFPPPAAFAQEQSGVTLTASAGFDGYCKEGHWIPVRVRLENQGASIDGQLEISALNTGRDSGKYIQPLSLPTTSRKEAYLYFYPESYISQLQVQFISGGKRVAGTSLSLNCTSTDSIYAILATNPAEFGLLSQVTPIGGRASLAQLSLEDIPDRASAMSALDSIVISGVDTGPLSSGQQQALAGWVASGGRLVITGGPSWQRSTAGLEELLPIRITGTRTLDALDALSSFTGRADTLFGSAVVAVGSPVEGAQTLASQDGTPLVVKKAFGHGEVIYLTIDPSLEPIKGWAAKEAFYQRLLVQSGTKPGWANGFSDWNAATNAVSTLPNLALPGGLLVIVFLFAYVGFMGPVNYVFLRLVKRREIAWLTIPVLVVVFSMLAFLIGSGARGVRPVLNRLAVVQVWPGVKNARVDALLGVFSPSRANLSLEVGPEFIVHPIPNNNALDRQGGWIFSGNNQGGVTMPDLRLDVGGLNAVIVEGQVLAPEIEYDLELKLNSSGATITGSITNKSNLELENAVLLAPGSALQLGTLAPNKKTSVDLALPPDARSAQGTTATGSPYTGYPSYSYDSTANDIMGTANYYNDSKLYQRYTLINALTNPYGYYNAKPNPGRGGGIYLAGWSDQSPLKTNLPGSSFINQDATLYLITLGAEISSSQAEIRLPPAFFSWSVLEDSQGAYATPYDMYLDRGSYSLSFILIQPIEYQSVESMTLHLISGYGYSGQTDLEISLWDFNLDDWVQVDVDTWGNHDIPGPERFINENGEIRVQLENPQYGSVSIQKIDFTLVVK